MHVRLFGLAAAAALLSACTFGVDETATADAALLQFSASAADLETQEALALAAAPDATDPVAAAGANVISAIFAPDAATPSRVTTHRFGDPVAYGKIAPVCGASRRDLGRKIDSAGGFSIYDSDPSSTALRAHYITGFDDRCPRQFSAALVLTGTASMHEKVRYLPRNRLDYNATDSAYEAIKASFCRVRHGKPCGGRLRQLDRVTTFITAYESFGSRPQWVEILLHDGEMTAIDFKAR